MTDATKGNCFCGAIEIEAAGAPVEMGYCHCNSCRSYTAEDVSVTKGKDFVGRFEKTEMSDRQFCTRCGRHLMTHHPTFGLTDVRAAVIPRVTFKPVIHLHYAETVLPMKEGLPKFRDFPIEAGGSGELVPE